MKLLNLFATAGIAAALPGFAAADISFSCGPTRLINLQKQFGDMLGRPVIFDGTTENEVIAIQVDKVGSDVFMTKVAEATSATWVEENGSFRLTRPAAINRKEEDAETKAQWDSLTQSIKGQSHPIQDLPKSQADVDALIDLLKPKTYLSDTQIQKNMYKAMSGVPENAIRADLVSAIDPKRLFNLADGEGVTFCTNPNRMQVPFANDLSGALSRFAQLKSWWHAAGQKIAIEASEQNSIPPNIKMAIEASPNGKYYAAALVVRRSSGFMATFYVYDQSGRLATPNISAYFFANPNGQTRYPRTSGQGEIELPPILAEAGRVANDLQYGATVKDEIRDLLIHPSSTDPLQLSFAALVPSYAKAKHINVVADIPDVAATRLNARDLLSRRAFTVNSLPGILGGLCGMSASESTGWEVWKPSAPFSARRSRADRKGVQQFVDAAVAHGIVPLDDQADIAFKYGPATDALGSVIASFAIPFFTQFYRFQQPDSLWFYGSLSRGQRAALAEHRMTFGDLPPSARGALERIFYGETHPRRGVAGDSILALTTMAYPDGIPPASPVDLQLQKWRGLLVAGPEGTKEMPYIMQFGTGTRVNRQQDTESHRQRFMLFDSVNCALVFVPYQDPIAAFSLYSYDNASNPTPVPFDKLPKAVQAELGWKQP